jgi:hypothetical protein
MTYTKAVICCTFATLLWFLASPLIAEEPAVDGKPVFSVRANGWDAEEAFRQMADVGVYVLTLGNLNRTFIVPVDLRRKAVPAGTFVEGVAAFRGIGVFWSNSGVSAAVLQKPATDAAVAGILRDLGSGSEDARINAAWMAGWMTDVRIVPALVKATSDGSSQVARHALDGIRHLGWPAVAVLCPKEALSLLSGEIARYGRAQAVRRRRGSAPPESGGNGP